MPRDITTICAHPDTWAAHGVFNPNEWRSKSKAIVRSCSAQLGLLLHMTSEAAHALERGEAVCKLRLQELQKQWRTHPWRLDRSQYLVEVPTVHVLVQAYLSSAKTLLDFLAQLTTTEGVVGKVVHGFHKKGDDPGGELLGILKTRAAPGRRDQAERLRAYLAEQKDVWIDDLVDARDFLAHPKRGMAQIYWGIDLVEMEGALSAKEWSPPRITGQPFHEYLTSQTDTIGAFAKEYVQLVRTPEARTPQGTSRDLHKCL